MASSRGNADGGLDQQDAPAGVTTGLANDLAVGAGGCVGGGCLGGVGSAGSSAADDITMDPVLAPEDGETWLARALERWAREGHLY